MIDMGGELLPKGEAGHETVAFFPDSGHLQFMPTAPAGRQPAGLRLSQSLAAQSLAAVAMAAVGTREDGPLTTEARARARAANELGVARWCSGRRAPSLRAEFRAGKADGELLEFVGATPRGNSSRHGVKRTLLAVPTKAAAAIDVFDSKHRNSALRAERIYKLIRTDETHLAKQRAMREVSQEVGRDRAHVAEAIPEVRRIVSKVMSGKKSAPKLRWKIEESIWAPRKAWCDARDYFDSDAVERAAFEADWRVARKALQKFVEQHDDGKDDEDGLDEIMEVADVLWEHHDIITICFKFYSTLRASDDIFHVFANGFAQFAEDFDLIDSGNEFAKKSAWDQMFVAVDSGGGLTKEEDLHNRKKALNRQEFMQAIVRAAVARYVQPGIEVDVSTALNRLFTKDIGPKIDRIPGVTLRHPNEFRRHLYGLDSGNGKLVDDVLRQHEPALRLIFKAICGLKPFTMENGGLANGLATYSNWRDFLRLFNLIDLDCSERDATLCFAWSKMTTINEQNTKDRIKMTHLSFEDFLEACCRLACLKALPTDEEILWEDEDGNAGVHLLRMQEVPADYDAFLKERRTAWGQMPRAMDPLIGDFKFIEVNRQIEHLCELLIVTAQGGKNRDDKDGLTLTQKQVAQAFAKKE